MSTKTRISWLSGFCSAGSLERYPDSHAQCDKHPRYEKPCSCACHWVPETPAGREATVPVDVPGPLAITEPCLMADLGEASYHADPVPEHSLSASGAKLLLEPSTPAHFRWRMDNPQEHKQAFDVGHAVHAKVLGVGAPVAVIPFDHWGSNAAKAAVKEARDAGLIPLKQEEFDAVEAMGEAVLKDQRARFLFSTGGPEVSAFWRDEPTKVMLRARFDWLPDATERRFIVPDLKSAVSAERVAFGKAAASFGYDVQQEFYRNAVKAHGIDPDPAFLFVVVEKTPPYLVNVIELDEDFRRCGAQRARQAIDLFDKCMTEDHWPGYPGVQVAPAPRWFTYNLEDE